MRCIELLCCSIDVHFKRRFIIRPARAMPRNQTSLRHVLLRLLTIGLSVTERVFNMLLKPELVDPTGPEQMNGFGMIWLFRCWF